MIKIGSYNLHRDGLKLIGLILSNNLRTSLFGLPRRKGKSPIAMAKEVLKENINKHLVYAGKGHFRLMWISDFSVALKGLSKILKPKKIESIIQFIIDQSYQHGHTQTSFSLTKGLDLPYPRGDSFPWLIHGVKEYFRLSRNQAFLKRNKRKLQKLMSAYQKHFLDDNGLVLKSATGDWADTIKRPSSTWNNLLALYVSKVAKSLGLKSNVRWKDVERTLLKDRYRNGYFIDYAGAKMPSVDAPILALYLGLFNKATRLKLANWLESKSNILRGNCPAKASLADYPRSLVPWLTKLSCAGYHSRAHWMHLGLMWANGLKALGRDYQQLLQSAERTVRKYRNFIEVVDFKGNLFRKILSCEHGFTMSAGQYLELVD